jgi:hypothetical protein
VASRGHRGVSPAPLRSSSSREGPSPPSGPVPAKRPPGLMRRPPRHLCGVAAGRTSISPFGRAAARRDPAPTCTRAGVARPSACSAASSRLPPAAAPHAPGPRLSAVAADESRQMHARQAFVDVPARERSPRTVARRTKSPRAAPDEPAPKLGRRTLAGRASAETSRAVSGLGGPRRSRRTISTCRLPSSIRRSTCCSPRTSR